MNRVAMDLAALRVQARQTRMHYAKETAVEEARRARGNRPLDPASDDTNDEHGSESDWVPVDEMRLRTSQALRPKAGVSSTVGFDLRLLPRDLVQQVARPMREMRALWRDMRQAKAAQQQWVDRARSLGKHELAAQHPVESIDPHTLLEMVSNMLWLTQADPVLPPGAQAVLPPSLRESITQATREARARGVPESDLPSSELLSTPNYEPFYTPRDRIHDEMPYLPSVAASLRQELMEMVPVVVEKLRGLNTQNSSGMPMQIAPSAALPLTRGENGEQRAMTPEEHVDAVIQKAIDASVAATAGASSPASSDTAASPPPAPPASDVQFVAGQHAGTNRALPSAWHPIQFVRIYSSLAHNSMRLAYRLHDLEWAERMLELQRVCTECAMAHPSFQRLQALTSAAASSASAHFPLASLGRDLRYWLSEGVHSADFFDDTLGSSQLSAHSPMWKERCMEFIVRANDISASTFADKEGGDAGNGTKLFASPAEMETAAVSLAYVGLQKQHHVGDLMDYVRLVQLHVILPLDPSRAAQQQTQELQHFSDPAKPQHHHRWKQRQQQTPLQPRMPPVRTSAAPGAPPVWLAYTGDLVVAVWSECQRLRLPLFAKHFANLAGVVSAVQHELINDMRLQQVWAGSTGHHTPLPVRFDPKVIEPSPPIVDRSGCFTQYESHLVQALQFFPSAVRVAPEQMERLRAVESQRLIDRCTQAVMEMSDGVRMQLELQQAVQRIEDFSRPQTLSGSSRALSKEQSRAKARGKYRTNLPFAILEHHPAAHEGLEALKAMMAIAPPNAAAAATAPANGPPAATTDNLLMAPHSARIKLRVVLRFLRPLICACVRSGLPHEALAALHMTLRCSMVPSYKLTSAVLFMLSEETLRLNLPYMSRAAGFQGNPHAPVHSALHFQVTQHRTRNDALCDNIYQPQLLPLRTTAPPNWSVLQSTLAWASTIQSSWPMTYDTIALLLRIYSDVCSFCYYALEIQRQQTQARIAKRGRSAGNGNRSTTSIPLTAAELRAVRSQALENYMALLKVVHGSSTYFRLRDRRMDHESLRPFEIRMVREEIRRKREVMAREVGTDDKLRMPPTKSLGPKEFRRHRNEAQAQVTRTADHPFMDRSSVVDGSPPPKVTPEILVGASIPLLQSWINTGRTRRHGASTMATGFGHNGWKQSLFRLITFSLEAVLRAVAGDAHRSFQLVQQVLALHLDPPEPIMRHTLHELMTAEEARFKAARRAAEQAARSASKRGRTRSRFKKLAVSSSPDASLDPEAAEDGAGSNALVSASLPLNLPAKHASHAAWVLLIMCDLGMDLPLASVEWVHSVLATSPTLADQFYLHCLRRRMQQMFMIPSRPIWSAWIVAEGTKLAVASALLARPLATIRPPSAFESQAAEQAEAEEDLEMGEEMPTFDSDATEGQGWEQRSAVDAPAKAVDVPAADDESPFFPDGSSAPRIRATQGDIDAGHAVDAEGYLVIPEEELRALREWSGGAPDDDVDPSLEAEIEEEALAADAAGAIKLPEAVQDHETQWEWVLRHSGLFPRDAAEAHAQLNVPGRMYPEAPALQGLTLESAEARGGLFRRWLASTLTLDPEHLLSILDCMRSSGVAPDLACFHRALEVLAQMCALAAQPALEEVLSVWSPASTSTPSPVRALHYALLLLSDLRALGLQPDATFLNNLLYILICNRRHALVQELLSTSSTSALPSSAGAQQMGFTMVGGGLRRVIDEAPTAASSSAAAADSATEDRSQPSAPVMRVADVLSLGEELDVLELALDAMATQPPPYEVSELGPSGREQERAEADSAAPASSSAARTLPLYVRPDSVTLSVLLGGQAAMEYPSNLYRFMRQLQEREELLGALDAREREWNQKLKAEHSAQAAGNPAAQPFRPRTWRHQREA